MEKNISIKKNFVMNIILTMSSFIFPLITFPYISRVLGPDSYGKVSFGLSVITYFSMIAELGIPTYGIRACATVRDNRKELTRTAQELLIINLFMTVVAYVALAIALATVQELRSQKTLILVVSATIFLTTIGMEWLYKALEQYTYITVRSLLFKMISVVAMFLLVHSENDYVIYGGITVIASSASYVLNLVNAHKFIGFKPVGNYNFKRHFKAVGVFFAMSVATTVYTHLDTVMLGFMATDADVGFYNASVRIKMIMVSVVTSLGSVLLPRLSYYIEKKDMIEFKRITQKALNFVLLISIPITVYFILYAKQGIYLLSGSAYTESILPMQIIMPTVLLIGLSNLTGLEILVPLGKENNVLYSEIIGAIVDVIINYITIPYWKSAGAALGTLVAEFVVFVFQYMTIHKEMSGMFKKVPYGKLLLATVIASAASLWVDLLHLGSFITLLITAILFFGTYVLVMLITKDSLSIELVNIILQKMKIRYRFTA